MRKILVAEDDALVRQLVVETLEEGGFSVLECADGAQAWERLRAEGADIAVLDINMPRMNGLDLMRRMRSDERHKGVPVLMLTVRTLLEDQLKSYERGADDYLTKPFDPKMLVARVKLLERRILDRK